MKKSAILISFVLSLSMVAALACDLNATLLNQDPNPAVPGDYVKLVFQIELANPINCDDITFHLVGDYPIKFNPDETGYRMFKKVDYIKDFSSSIQIPIEVRVDSEALDGENPIQITMQSRGDAMETKELNLEVEDTRADFEVYVKNYDSKVNELTFEILNIAKVNTEALTVEIPRQENIEVKGPSRVNVGDLDSNEYTTAEFEATLKDGDIEIELTYSDSINVRRTVTKTIKYDSSYFTDRIVDQTSTPIWSYIIIALLVILITYWVIKKITKKKKN